MQLPPDERIDAPPPRFEWSERIRSDGGAIVFRGTRPPSQIVVWMASALGAVVVLGFSIAFRVSHLDGVLVVVLLGMLVVSARKWHRSADASAEVDVDAARVRVEPASLFVRARQFPLAKVDYFSAETQIETVSSQHGGGRIEAFRWYPVHARLTNGDQVTVAAFGEREQALFLAQRLQALTERARSVIGRREPAQILPKPYR